MALKRNQDDMSEPAQLDENPEEVTKSGSEPMDPERPESKGNEYGTGETTDTDPEHREQNRANWKDNKSAVAGGAGRSPLNDPYIATESNTVENRQQSRVNRFEQARRDKDAQEQKEADAKGQKRGLALNSGAPSQDYMDKLEQTPVEQLIDRMVRVRMARYRPGRHHSERQDIICLCCGSQYRPDDVMDGTQMFICGNCSFAEEEEIELERQQNEQGQRYQQQSFRHG